MVKYDSSKFQGKVRKHIQKKLFLLSSFDMGFPVQTKDDVIEVLSDLNLFYDEIAEDTITVTYKRTLFEKVKSVFGMYTKGKLTIEGVGIYDVVIPDELRVFAAFPMKMEWISVSRNVTNLLAHEAFR